MDAPATPAGQPPSEEVLFLIVQALADGPFAQLGAALAADATARGLLPRRRSIHGGQHALTFPELQRRYAHLPPDALQQLLSQLLERRRSEAPQPAARGLTSLLEPGALSVLSGASTHRAPHQRPAAWLRPAAALPSQVHRLLLLRQAGLLRSAQHPATLQPPEEFGRVLQHQLTVRGHRFAVYCVTYDRTGRYIVTGSDDRLVKIWSTRTGLLQASCRGHDAEITDLAVSCDNSLVASSSMDSTIRVWQLEGGEGRPGLPASVLVGHTGPAAFVDFHPWLPDALLSASFDGTCRIWRARDAAAPPVVLRVDPDQFGLAAQAAARLGGLAWQRFAGSGLAGGSGGLQASGMRTTRGMERQLAALLGPSTAAGNNGAGSSQQPSQQHSQQQSQQQQSQQGRPGVRHSGRSAQQLRNMSDIMAFEAGDDAALEDEDGEQDGGAAEAAAAAAAGGSQAAGDGEDGHDPGGAPTGLLVCGFSRDGTHIAAGGNDCNVYVWEWAVQPPGQPQQLSPPAQQRGGRRGVLGAASGTPKGGDAAKAAAAEAELAAGPPPAAAAAAGVAAAAPGEGSAAGAAEQAEPGRAQDAQQPPPPSQQQQQQQQASPAGRGRRRQSSPRQAGTPTAAAAAAAAAAGDAPWPAPMEVCQLKGHRNDVVLLQFSHDGERVATGSKDGSVRVWRRPRRWRRRAAAWEQEVTFAVLPDPEAIKEARRRRRPPPAPSIDQLSWTADDQRLVVSVTDYGIRVLAMPGGQVLHNLKLHTSNVHILECHPTDPSLAFSASYDGTLLLWSTLSGAVLRRFSSRQTRPDGRSWPDVLPFADGHFSPDGRTITVADVAGQLHHYAPGPPSALLSRAPYDQFLTTDYNPLIRDLHHNVLDADTQLPPHMSTGREALCDALGTPYPLALQAAFREQRMLTASPQEVAWQEPGKEPGYLLAAPILTAAAWAVEQTNGTDHAIQMAVARAQERLTVYEDRLNAGASAAVAREAAAAAGQPARRRRGGGWVGAEGEEDGEVVVIDEAAEPASSGEMYSEDGLAEDSDEDVDSTLLTSEEDDEDEFEDDEGGREARGGRRRGRRAPAEASRHSSRLAGRRQAAAGGGRRGGGRRREEEEEEIGVDEAEQHAREERQRQDREARAARRRAAQQEQLAEERHRRQRQAAARRRPAAAETSEEEEEEVLSEAESEGAAGPSRRASHRPRRRRRAELYGDSDAEHEAAAGEGRQRKRPRHGAGWRELANYAWLAVCEQTPGVYVPQAGDDVVYLREGHQRFLEATGDKRQPPWATLRHGRRLRHAEPCRVVDVQYVIANDGTDHTLAQLTLSFSDDTSPLKDTCFTVEVPPPIAGHPEFVIHRSRFEASVISKCWEVGEQCQVYWNDDECAGAGKWWLGTIVQDVRDGENADVLADPFGAGRLWERFTLQWQGSLSPAGELQDDTAADAAHSPWELYVPGTTRQAALQESPTLDEALAQRMLAAVQAAQQQERFAIFVEAPRCEEQYVSLNRRTQPYNRLVALPLALSEVESRLRSRYYRQPAALASDIATIASNACTFNGEDNALAEDAAALAAYLTAVLQGQEADIATYAAFPEDVAAAEAAAAATAERGRGRRSRSTRRHTEGEDDEEEQQQQQQQWPELLQRELEQAGAAPLPALPLFTGGVAGGAAAGRAGGGGMRVRFTVPPRMRAGAAEGGAAATEGSAPELPSQASLAAAASLAALAAPADAAAATAMAIAAGEPGSRGGAGLMPAAANHAAAGAPAAEPTVAQAQLEPQLPLELPPDLLAGVAAAIVGGTGPSSGGQLPVPAAAAVGTAAGTADGMTWEAGAAGQQQQQEQVAQQQQPQQQHPGAAALAAQPAFPSAAPLDDAWQHAFQPQWPVEQAQQAQQAEQPRQARAGRRRAAAVEEDADWMDDEDEEISEDSQGSAGEDSYQPEEAGSSSAEEGSESDSEGSGGWGGGRRRASGRAPARTSQRARRR